MLRFLILLRKRQSVMRLFAFETIEILYSDALCNKNNYFDIQSYHLHKYMKNFEHFQQELNVSLQLL